MEKHLTEIEKDNRYAARLLDLSVAVWPLAGIGELFKLLAEELQGIADFDAADVFIFNDDASARHSRYTFKNRKLYEFVGVTDPNFFSAQGRASLSGLFLPGLSKQISGSYWINRVPEDSLFFKKETEYKYTFYIPFFRQTALAGFFQFRTDNRDGFSDADQDVLALTGKLLAPKLDTLLRGSALAKTNDLTTAGLDLLKLELFALNKDIAAIHNKEDLNKLVQQKIKALFPELAILIFRTDNGGKSYQPVNGSSNSDILSEEELLSGENWFDSSLCASSPLTLSLNELAGKRNAPKLFNNLVNQGWTKVVFALLESKNRNTGLLLFFLKDSFEIPLFFAEGIREIAKQLSVALNNVITSEKIEDQFDEIRKYKQQLETENNYLQEEIATAFNYNDVVGLSPIMQNVFHMVSQVADTMSSVLILGETGTGKELIARALHNTSSRKKKTMIKINCAALPANLIESELFGHERGSFTGATERRIGKFELANNSTLFLDEIGELPLDLQGKLLRALQEREIERIGGTTVIKVNVRIVAATNRNLLEEVHAGNFRSDLYFRLNVFPIILPPLRERKEDIPLLAGYFLEKLKKKATRRITGFSSRVLKQLTAYNWPGNVRELEHMVERCVLLASGPVINQIPDLLTGTDNMGEAVPDMRIRTIDEIERAHIMMVLKKCSNKVAGIGGAADVLQIPASTLNSKMRRLNIKRAYKGKSI
jgi:formate hydrogenlyase transcriptional activator